LFHSSGIPIYFILFKNQPQNENFSDYFNLPMDTLLANSLGYMIKRVWAKEIVKTLFLQSADG